jgi:hypothetical protein
MSALDAYATENYILALQLVRKELSEHGDPTNAWIAADICWRNLDGGHHRPEEAVELYWIAASTGDTDVISWLMTLLPCDVAWEDVTEAMAKDALRSRLRETTL